MARQNEVSDWAGIGGALRRDYRVLDVKEGGLCRVFIVQDKVTGRHLALKALKPEYARSRAVTQLFRDEVKSWIELSHQEIMTAHIVRAEGYEEFDGLVCVCLEYVHGYDLSAYGRVTGVHLPQRIAIVRQLCLGMDFLRMAMPGLVHCDLKPANVLVKCMRWVSEEAGTSDLLPPDMHVVRIADFGLSRIHTVDVKQNRLPAEFVTHIKAYSRLNPYTAPECRDDPQAFSVQSDIFSVGMILLETVLENLVDHETAKRALLEFCSGVTERPMVVSNINSELGERLDEILWMALSRVPSRRFGCFSEMANALSEVSAESDRKTIHITTSRHVDYLELAYGAFQVGDIERAELLFDKAIEREDEPGDKAHAIANKAALYLNTERLEEAFRLLDQALQLADDQFFVWYVRGHALFQAGQHPEAVLCYDRCLALNPDWRQAALERVECRRMM